MSDKIIDRIVETSLNEAIAPFILEEIIIETQDFTKNGKLINYKFENFCLFLDVKVDSKSTEDKIKRFIIPYSKYVISENKITFTYDIDNFDLISEAIKKKYPIKSNLKTIVLTKI